MSEIAERGAAEREPGCGICEILETEEEGFVLDTRYWRVIVSRDQGYLGRCMIIPLRHLAEEADLSEEEVLDFHYLKVRLETGVKMAFGASLCNWTELGNDAFQSEDPKPHLHHHMRPRYSSPKEFRGHVFDDPNWGHMYDLNQRWNLDKDSNAGQMKAALAQEIRLAIIDSTTFSDLEMNPDL